MPRDRAVNKSESGLDGLRAGWLYRIYIYVSGRLRF
jgi:hypothetical protein